MFSVCQTRFGGSEKANASNQKDQGAMKPQTEGGRAKMRVGAKQLRQHESIFFHPDCTVGTGITPVHAFRLAGCTAGGESHPALKMLGLSGANCCSGEAVCQVVRRTKPAFLLC